MDAGIDAASGKLPSDLLSNFSDVLEGVQERLSSLRFPEGPYILPLWNWAPKDLPYHGFGNLIP